MNNDETIEFITERLADECNAITHNLVITLLNKMKAEIKQKDVQLETVQKLYTQLKARK